MKVKNDFKLNGNGIYIFTRYTTFNGVKQLMNIFRIKKNNNEYVLLDVLNQDEIREIEIKSNNYAYVSLKNSFSSSMYNYKKLEINI